MKVTTYKLVPADFDTNEPALRISTYEEGDALNDIKGMLEPYCIELVIPSNFNYPTSKEYHPPIQINLTTNTWTPQYIQEMLENAIKEQAKK